jgi:hypothetical protein
MGQGKRETTQFIRSRKERGNITTDFTEMQRIVREFYELDVPKVDNLNKMDKFLGRHKPLKLIKEVENCNKLISSKEIKLVILKLPVKETPSPIVFIDKFCQK